LDAISKWGRPCKASLLYESNHSKEVYAITDHDKIPLPNSGLKAYLDLSISRHEKQLS